MGQIADSWSSLKGASSGILESFVGAHSLNILSRLRSLSGGPVEGGCNWWQLRPHGNMGMAVPSHHSGHLTWDQGCIWYFGRWEVHRSSPNHSQTRSFNRKSQNTSLLVIQGTRRRANKKLARGEVPPLVLKIEGVVGPETAFAFLKLCLFS